MTLGRRLAQCRLGAAASARAAAGVQKSAPRAPRSVPAAPPPLSDCLTV